MTPSEAVTKAMEIGMALGEIAGQRDEARRESERLRAEIEQLRLERDLAIAHDRQPYPTAEAYEQATRTLSRYRDALQTIVSMDYRGNEPPEHQVARLALEPLK